TTNIQAGPYADGGCIRSGFSCLDDLSKNIVTDTIWRSRKTELARLTKRRYDSRDCKQGVAPIRWDVHEVSFCEPAAQPETAVARASCHCRGSGRADCGSRRSCGCPGTPERTLGRVHRLAHCRRADH